VCFAAAAAVEIYLLLFVNRRQTFQHKKCGHLSKALDSRRYDAGLFYPLFLSVDIFFKGNPLLFFLYMSFDSAITFKG
jgi:hypothetical protein